MPSGRAVKPGDIVRATDGTTIEIINTDAEGRLVLADCLAHAREQGAERLVDLATLTGGDRHRARARPRRPDGQRRRLVRGGRARPATRPASASGGCRSTRDYAELIKGRYADIMQRGRGPQGGLDHRRRVPRALRGRRAVGAPRHRRASRRPRRARTRPRAASGCGVRLLRASSAAQHGAADGLRPLRRPRADPPHRPRLRRGRGRAGGRGARPDEGVPVRDRRASSASSG